MVCVIRIIILKGVEMNFSQIINRIKEAFVVSGYSRTVKMLQGLSDQQLADIGISRRLLKQGASAYPWREEQVVVSQVVPVNLTKISTSKIIENTPIMPRAPKAA